MNPEWILYAVIAVGIAVFLLLRMRTQAAASKEARAAVAAGALLVDVRTPEEFAAGHLEGARNIPIDAVQRRIGEFGNKKRTVVVYCRSGARSSAAKRILESNGFAQVINLGPKSAW